MAKRLNQSDQTVLIDLLRNLGAGQAEGIPANKRLGYFLPVKEHLRVLDVSTVLIIGNRGTGKSALFGILGSPDGISILKKAASGVELPEGRFHWVSGYPASANFPDYKTLEKEFRDVETSVDFWNAFLVRHLVDFIPESSFVKKISDFPAPDLNGILKYFNETRTELFIALDQLDKRLIEENSWVFVGYDELDTLHPYNYNVMARGVEGLISFWAFYSRRWKRIRPKLFIRTDMYRKHSLMGGAELAKLSANRVELHWDDLNLYRMLIKTIANKDERLKEYCEAGEIKFEKDSDFGWIPNIPRVESVKPFFKRLTGEFMGANNNKGYTYTWVLNHIRDGNKEAHPRNLVLLIGRAAEKERGNPKANPPHLIHHTVLNQALTDLSNAAVASAKSDWKWLNAIQNSFEKNNVTSMTISDKMMRQVIHDIGQSDFESRSGLEGNRLLELLQDLGVIIAKKGSRYDIPDIYLRGLGLTRKGGVKKK